MWTAAAIGDPGALAVRFSAAELAQMDAVVAAAGRAGWTAEDVPDGLFDWPAVDRRMKAVLAELQGGRGFVVMDGLPVERMSKADLQLVYWGLGLSLGSPVSQSVKGDRLGQVRDMTATDPNARAYQNKNELSPHTDHTELVGLMCLRDALSGGETPLANALAIHNEILATRPDLLAPLYRGFRYHRRGEEQEGDAPMTPHRVPVFSRVGDTVSCRLIRPYIEAGAAAQGVPLTAEETAALDLVRELARDPRFRVPLRLAPGSVIFFNNYVVLHERTPFVDRDAPDEKRHLVRLWLVPEDFRDVVPEIEIYSTKGGIQRRENAPAQFDWGVGGR